MTTTEIREMLEDQFVSENVVNQILDYVKQLEEYETFYSHPSGKEVCNEDLEAFEEWKNTRTVDLGLDVIQYKLKEQNLYIEQRLERFFQNICTVPHRVI